MTRIFTWEAFEKAHEKVLNDLTAVGLLEDSSKLYKTEVFYCRLPQVHVFLAEGFFLHNDSVLGRPFGYIKGHIYVPKMNLGTFWAGRDTPIADILRHEWGHAVVYHYHKLTDQTRAWKDTFTACEGECVSDYATTDPEEDWAETFMYYLKRRGKPYNKWSGGSPVADRWAYIRKVCAQVRKGKASFR